MTAFAEIAGMNIPNASNNAIQMLNYMDNFISGTIHSGMTDTIHLTARPTTLTSSTLSRQHPITSWAQLAQANSADYPLLSTEIPTRAILRAAGFRGVAKTALADLITYTQSPGAIEAFGFSPGKLPRPGGTTSRRWCRPIRGSMWDVMPRLPDGEYLQATQMQIDVSNSRTVILTATGATRCYRWSARVRRR